MNTPGRPVWRSRVRYLAGTAFAVLAVALLAVGARGPLAVVMPLVITVTAFGVAVWAVRRGRAERAAHEARLTEWAASEAVLVERLRVARDLHDIVSHGLGFVTVRAAAARHVIDAGDTTRHSARGAVRDATRDAARGTACETACGSVCGTACETVCGTACETACETACGTACETACGVAAREAREALADIEEASRNATTELRRMLAVLRRTDGPETLDPVEDLSRVPEIVRAARLAGLRVRLDLEPVGEVSPGVQLAVCKVIREALDNAARHAGPTDVRVRLRRDAGTVVVTVDDDGPMGHWTARPGAGHGLLGLNERVSALGGVLGTEHAGHGFHVTARIPDGETA
ncbi:histidine kinase [Streptosporangium sp. NPDC004379]|uniref:sensor histidine kinase n=1 Tax=Streptosporangium sp. NPDC004379 TaxID=3366189 RepID=UPI0036B588E1